ncbi:unnamed protein product [Camellia sinensis]
MFENSSWLKDWSASEKDSHRHNNRLAGCYSFRITGRTISCCPRTIKWGPGHHATCLSLVDSDETQAPSETQPIGVGTSKPTCVRGPTLGKGIQKIIRAKKGKKCYVHIDRALNAMTGKYATPATNELGIQIRSLCPLKNVKSWLDLAETTKSAVIQSVLDKFEIGDDFHNDLQAQKIVNKKAYGLYKDWRYTLKQEFELLEGLSIKEIYAHLPLGVSLDDWKHLIDVAWQDASHQVAKTGELDFPKFYEDSHTSKKTYEWIHSKCRRDGRCTSGRHRVGNAIDTGGAFKVSAWTEEKVLAWIWEWPTTLYHSCITSTR